MKIYTCCIAAVVLMPMCSSSDPNAATTSTVSAANPATATTADAPCLFTSVGDTVKPDAPNAAFYDFGTLSLARTEPIHHDFTLQNTTTQPIDIARIQAACGCTTATSDLGVPGDYKPVAPGKNFTIGVSVDPGHLYVGSIDKMVWVYVTNQTTPAYTLHMIGTMTAAASFEPAVLNFGTVHAGGSAEQELTVTLDVGAYGQYPPDPRSTNPDIQINRSSVQSWELNREPFYTQPGVNPGTHVAAPALPRSQRGFEPYDPLADRVYQAIGLTHINVKYITVTAKHGEVVLIGTVDNAQQLKKTLDAAAHVPGVEHIQNELTIAQQ